MKIAIFNGSSTHLFISLTFLLLTQTHPLNATLLNDIANFQEQQLQPSKEGDLETKLSHYGSLMSHSSGELFDGRNLLESLLGGNKQVAPSSVPLHHLNAVTSGKAKKLITWIRRQSLQDASHEDGEKTLDNTLEIGGQIGKDAEQSMIAKRVNNCKPLKEQLKEFRGKWQLDIFMHWC